VGLAFHEAVEFFLKDRFKNAQSTLVLVRDLPPIQFVELRDYCHEWINSKWDDFQNRISDAPGSETERQTMRNRNLTMASKLCMTFLQSIYPFRFMNQKIHSIEKSIKLELVKGIQIIMKIDFCTIDCNDKIIITDWKTGDNNFVNYNSPQLATYYLWAIKEFGSKSKVEVQYVFPKTGQVNPIILDEYFVNNLRNQVIEESVYWRDNDDIASYNCICGNC